MSDERLRAFPVILILGPRQVGKSSLLRYCRPNCTVINLDDLAVRTQVTSDPVLFSENLIPPFIIDEIQYAPQLLSAVKRLADSGSPANSIWITGSQNFEVMKGVHETLAGRVAILNLYGLSDQEKKIDGMAPDNYFQTIFETSFPKILKNSDLALRELYLSSYVQTYIERDVRELLGIQKRREFEVFLKACALRTGQLINYDELGRTVGISPITAKEWISLLEDSFLLKLINPWHSNRSKRLVKTPKLYFLDMGLAAYLAGWKTAEMLALGAMRGAAFETHVFGSLLRYLRHRGRDANIHFYRTRDGLEIDFLVETSHGVIPIEVKVGTPTAGELPKLEAIRDSSWGSGTVLSLQLMRKGEAVKLNKDWTARSLIDLGFID